MAQGINRGSWPAGQQDERDMDDRWMGDDETVVGDGEDDAARLRPEAGPDAEYVRAHIAALVRAYVPLRDALRAWGDDPRHRAEVIAARRQIKEIDREVLGHFGWSKLFCDMLDDVDAHRSDRLPSRAGSVGMPIHRRRHAADIPVPDAPIAD